MNIFISRDKKQRWIFTPYRTTHSSSAKEQSISEVSKQYHFNFIHTFSSGNTVYASFTSEENTFDFASRLLSYCLSRGLSNVIYIEQTQNDVCCVVISDSEIKKDFISTIEDVNNEVINFLANKKNQKEFTLIEFNFLQTQEVNSFIVLFKGVETLSAALTDVLEAEQEYKFLNERDALLKIQKRKPYGLFLIVLVGLISIVYFLLKPEDEAKQIVDLNPYKDFYSANLNDSPQIYNRLAQDYNTHVSLLLLPGWSVLKVSHTKGQISYEVTPKTKGELSHLESFAKKNNLHVLVGPSETTLVGHASNISLKKSESEVSLYKVEEVHHFLSDAITNYIPNSQLTFLRDIPQGAGNKWVIREVLFSFNGIYKEDLLTLGALTKELPVSFGGDISDQNIGQYSVSKERFTGSFKLSVLGEKL